MLGNFTETNDEVVSGVIVYKWAAGCKIGGVEIGAALKLETDYRAVRVSDFDLSGIEADPAMDQDGEPL